MSANDTVPLSRQVPYSALPDVERTIERLKAKSGWVPKFKWQSKPHHVGIEVEVERVMHSNPIGADYIYSSEGVKIAHVNMWDNKEDGSLRNNGREFVSVPAAGENVEFLLTMLEASLTKAAAAKGYEFTDRTSVHVHLNIRDLTPKQLANFILTYIIVEPVLYNFAGGERHRNIFCVPLNQSELGNKLSNVFTSDDMINSMRIQLGSWRKYLGLNLAPVFGNNGQHVKAFGTVEFRHMPGNLDVQKLLTWIDLIGCIKDYAQRTTLEQNQSMFLQLNTTSEYQIVLQNIFGSLYAGRLMFDNINRRMEEAVLFLKGCFSSGLHRFREFCDTDYVSSIIKGKESEALIKAMSDKALLVRVSKSKSTTKKAKAPLAVEEGAFINGFGIADRNAGAFRIRPAGGGGGADVQPQVEWVVEGDQPPPAPHLPHLEGLAPPRTMSTGRWVQVSQRLSRAEVEARREREAAQEIDVERMVFLRESYVADTEMWSPTDRTYLKQVINVMRRRYGVRRLY